MKLRTERVEFATSPNRVSLESRNQRTSINLCVHEALGFYIVLFFIVLSIHVVAIEDLSCSRVEIVGSELKHSELDRKRTGC